MGPLPKSQGPGVRFPLVPHPFLAAEEPAPSRPENPTSCILFATLLLKHHGIIRLSFWFPFITMNNTNTNNDNNNNNSSIFSRDFVLFALRLLRPFCCPSPLYSLLDDFQLCQLRQGKLRHRRVQRWAGGCTDSAFSCSYPQIQLFCTNPGCAGAS